MSKIQKWQGKRLQTQVLEIADDTVAIRSLDWDRDRFDIEFACALSLCIAARFSFLRAVVVLGFTNVLDTLVIRSLGCEPVCCDIEFVCVHARCSGPLCWYTCRA